MGNNEIITLKLTKSQASNLCDILTASISKDDFINCEHLKLCKNIATQIEEQEKTEIKEGV